MSSKFDTNGESIKFVILSDIVYGVVIAVGFALLLDALRTHNATAVILLIWTYLLICDDWYGGHYLTAKYPYTQAIFFTDTLILLNFVMVAYLLSAGSVFSLLLLATYGCLAFAWNVCYLSICEEDSEQGNVLEIWKSGAVVLTSICASFFLIVWLLGFRMHSLVTALMSVALWVNWRISLLVWSWRKIGKVI